MGRAMARHMIGGGFAVAAVDSSAEAIEAVAALGADAAGTPAALAATCDAVFIAVGFNAEVEAVCHGDDGIFAGARPGTPVVVNSTVSADLVKRLEEQAAARGLRLLDVPIARGRPAAEAGTLLALVGGDEALLEEVRPMLACFCSDIVHLGGVGHGQVAKAVNNLLLWINGVGLMEAGRLAEGTGIDLPKLREAMMMSSGHSWALENWDAVTFTWALKDMQLLLDMADEAGGAFPLMGLVKELVKDGREAKLRGDAPGWTEGE
jgi:3-hydroxyisobutyrate dehydrogenase-like beta-hydroxyacid dehydrogenase